MDFVPCRESELIRDFINPPLYWKGTYVAGTQLFAGQVEAPGR